MRTVDAIERVLPSSRVDWGFKAEAATGTAPWVPNAAGTSGNGGGLRKASSPRKAGGLTSAGLKRWKAKAEGKAALRAAGVLSANPEQQSPIVLTQCLR